MVWFLISFARIYHEYLWLGVAVVLFWAQLALSDSDLCSRTWSSSLGSSPSLGTCTGLIKSLPEVSSQRPQFGPSSRPKFFKNLIYLPLAGGFFGRTGWPVLPSSFGCPPSTSIFWGQNINRLSALAFEAAHWGHAAGPALLRPPPDFLLTSWPLSCSLDCSCYRSPICQWYSVC